MIEIALDPYIGQHEKLGVGPAFKGNTEFLAHRAVRPVAAEHPIGLDLLDAAVLLQPRRHPGAIRRQADQFGVALDRQAQFADTLFENALGLILRHAQHKGIARVERGKTDMRDAAAVPIRVDAGNPLAGGEKVVGEPHQFEGLDGARMDRDRPRLHRAMRILRDQAAFDAVAREFVRRNQPGRPCAHDQHAGFVIHGSAPY